MKNLSIAALTVFLIINFAESKGQNMGIFPNCSDIGDPGLNGSQTYSQPTPSMLEIQKNKLNRIATFYKTIPASQQFGITFWGISDANSWIKNDWPLLFDKTFAKKPAYYGFWDGLKQ